MDAGPPTGFGLLVVGLVVYILAGILYIASTPPGLDLGWLGVLQVVSVALAAIVIEALCTVRPWVTRASAALAATILAEVAAISAGLEVRGRLGLLLVTAAVLLLIVRYVRDRATQIYAPATPVARRP